MKKILYYNWLQFDDENYYGGGVNIYQKNLIEQMIKNFEYEVWFLSSGKAYDKNFRQTYIRATDNIFSKMCKSYEVVNSPILSSAKLSFYEKSLYLNDETLKKVIGEFIEKHGGFDVIHFNNFEGLSLRVLELKKHFPQMQWIYSMHNYYLFCPEVQLWKNNSCVCENFHEGHDCVHCVDEKVWTWKVKKKHYYIKKTNEKPDSRFYHCMIKWLDFIDRFYMSCVKKKRCLKKQEDSYRDFAQFRIQNVQYFNRYMDDVLCVSECVKSIALKMGLRESKLFVEYIGTKFSEVVQRKEKDISKSLLTISYLGYMTVFKGFYFFLEALEDMSDDIAMNVDVVICAKNTDESAAQRIYNLKKKFHNVIYRDGYSHMELPEILKSVDLAIVPVLWEDNLPQIAIEQTAYNVPVLTSNLGGAKELSENDLFVFEAGNVEMFLERIRYFLEHKEELETYWNTYRGLVSMEEHVRRLVQYYEKKDYE